MSVCLSVCLFVCLSVCGLTTMDYFGNTKDRVNRRVKHRLVPKQSMGEGGINMKAVVMLNHKGVVMEAVLQWLWSRPKGLGRSNT